MFGAVPDDPDEYIEKLADARYYLEYQADLTGVAVVKALGMAYGAEE